MKKLFTLLLIANIFVVNSFKAQNLPIAVNDTFYVNYSDSSQTYLFDRNFVTNNDTLGSGTIKIIDTISYNGVNQVTVTMHPSPVVRVNKINFTTNPGYVGIDSIIYYLTDNGTPTGFDTAIIYIYVKRKNYDFIDLNNVKASCATYGLFHSQVNQVASFEVPKGSGSNTIYAANFWFAGLGSVSILHGYAELYSNNGATGNPGPIMYDSLYENYSYTWDRVWKVSAIDIQNHISGFSTTEVITNWPAHGDTTKGQAANLAPFVDVDFDGVYNPSLGDYPKIKGQQAIYFIRNSDRSSGNILFTKSKIEFHGMVYAYDCPEDSAINNTVFIDYKIINRSTSNLTDCYFGQWVDFDIGNSNDDFIGCDVSRGTFYGYNGDGNDENGFINGYGTNLPAQGVTFLKGAKQDNDGNDNPLTSDVSTAISQNGIPYNGLGIGFGDGVIDNEYVGLQHFMYYHVGTIVNGNGDPNIGADVNNYMKGNWLDGNHMAWGGDGNPLATGNATLPSNYMFPGDSDPLYWGTNGAIPTPTTWSESSVGNNPKDTRGVGSTGPFTLLAGESAEMELAFVFGRDYTTPGNNLGGIPVMQERVDSIRSYHANGFATTPCGGAIIGTREEIKEINNLNIYPNPFANQFFVNYKPSNTTMVEVYNLLGGKIVSQQITQHITLLDLSKQPNGVYFVRVTDGEEVLTKKVVKQ